MTQCYFCLHNVKEIDYKDTQTLKKFLSGQMKIYPRRKTGLCAKHQRQLKKAVKRARILGLLPFVIR
jgi:small subunit ribosomal protein S18